MCPGTLTSITNLATSLARNMDRLSLDEEHYTRQEEWRRQLPESLGDGLRQGLSRLGISLLGGRSLQQQLYILGSLGPIEEENLFSLRPNVRMTVK